MKIHAEDTEKYITANPTRAAQTGWPGLIILIIVSDQLLV